MKKLLIGLLTLGTLSAHASMLEVNGPLDATFFEAQVNDEKTYFETLGELFTAGTLPNPSKISNIAWSGRCFLKDKQNEPTNAGYIFRKKRTSDVGPLGEAVRSFEATSYWSPKSSPDFYDNFSIEQVFALPNHTFRFSDAKIKSNLVEINYEDLVSQLKVSGSYLVENLLQASTDAGPIGKQNVYARCYYFIPDLNN